MNELLDLTIAFDEGELDEDEEVRFAALLLLTGMVNSTGSYGRFVVGMIEAGFGDAIATEMALRSPASVVGVD